MERVSTLPLPLFASVVAFAVPDYAENLVPNQRKIPTEALKKLALVARAWRLPVQELVARMRLATLTLKIATGSRSELLEIRRQAVQRGPRVLDLRLFVGNTSPHAVYPAHYPRNRAVPTGPPPLNDLDLGWDALFAHLPRLQRLDLSEMPLDSRHVELVLQSAARYCQSLEALVLPGWEDSFTPWNVHSVLRAVYTALEQWRTTGKRGGLRQLKVPTLFVGFDACHEFFQHVVKYCPQVEYLDGYKQSLCEMDRLTCQHEWPLALTQWEEFNATCTNLREFHWVVAPFGDPFFRVFGDHVKPRLTKLTLAVNMLWDWEMYFEGCDEALGVIPDILRAPEDRLERPGYGFQATDASTVLKGCPALDDLEIELYHPVDLDEIGYVDPYDDETEDFPDQEMLNIDIFDDRFCESLATNCPLLTSFSIWEVAEGQNCKLTPIRTFTDLGLVALARLKFLNAMQLRTVNCTGNGVFEFLNNLSDEFMGQRTFQICVGGSPGEFKLAFYNAIPELLMQLASTSAEDLPLARQKFVLRMMNSSLESVEAEWSETYLRGLEPWVTRVKEAHPSLRLRITTTGRRGNTFRSIIELGLYTAHAEPSVWYGWDDEEKDPDVTFVNRGGPPTYSDFTGSDGQGGLPVELMHPELLDPDSLPIDYELPEAYLDGAYYDYDDYLDDEVDDFDDYDDGGFYDANADALWE
ncbi:hypothetical protein BBJ28_00012366 [Nothophytophthora sp. Chile5]|nr:hypothetical protein BBJ28_00012366 [Nothophytophthora sp. Chile5]